MKTCNCYEETESQLKAEGVKISDSCKGMRIRNLKLSMTIGFPLQTIDGKKPKRSQPRFLVLGYCPFCGEKYEKEEPTAATPQGEGKGD